MLDTGRRVFGLGSGAESRSQSADWSACETVCRHHRRPAVESKTASPACNHEHRRGSQQICENCFQPAPDPRPRRDPDRPVDLRTKEFGEIPGACSNPVYSASVVHSSHRASADTVAATQYWKIPALAANCCK